MNYKTALGTLAFLGSLGLAGNAIAAEGIESKVSASPAVEYMPLRFTYTPDNRQIMTVARLTPEEAQRARSAIERFYEVTTAIELEVDKQGLMHPSGSLVSYVENDVKKKMLPTIEAGNRAWREIQAILATNPQESYLITEADAEPMRFGYKVIHELPKDAVRVQTPRQTL